MIVDTRKTRSSAAAPTLAAFFALAIFAGASPARAQSPREDTNPVNSVLGFFGMQFDKDKDDIDYRARAPLVVPPKFDLPAPTQVAHAAGWPTDPDIEARRHAAAAAQRPAPQATPNARVEMSANELQRQSNDALVAPKAAPTSDCQAGSGTPGCLYTPWDMLKNVTGLGGGKPDTVAAGDPEPPRTYLTEPPSGYRKASSTVSATLDVPKETPDASDAGAYVRAQQHKTSVDN